MVRSLLCFAVCLGLSNAAMLTRETSYTRVPNNNNFQFGSGSGDKMAYDDDNDFLYVIGEGSQQLTIFDMSDPANPVEEQEFDISADGTPTAIDFCRSGGNEYVAIAFRGSNAGVEGKVDLYDTYNTGETTLVEWSSVNTYQDPRAVKFIANENCRKIITATGAPPGVNSQSALVNPAPHIEIFTYVVASWNHVQVNLGTDLSNARHILLSENHYNDIEFRDIALIGTTAYVTTGANDAIVEVNTVNGNLIGIHALPSRAMANGIDTANNNQINTTSREISGLRQSTAIKTVSVENVDYLLTADEGERRSYSTSIHGFDFEEGQEGRSFSKTIEPDYKNRLGVELNQTNHLGRLRFSDLETAHDGWFNAYSHFTNLKTFGGRSGSLWDTSLSLVDDTGSQFELVSGQANATVFNHNSFSGGATPVSRMDDESIIHGPMPTAVATTVWNNGTYAAFGSGRMGGIWIFRLSGNPASMTFDSYTRYGGVTTTNNNMYQSETGGTPHISDMRFIDDGTSQYLLVLGRQTGAFHVLELYEGVYT